LCFSCAFSEHKNHNCVEIKQATQNKNDEIMELLKSMDIQESISQIDETIEEKKEIFEKEYLKKEMEMKNLKDSFQQEMSELETSKLKLNSISFQDLNSQDLNILNLMKIHQVLLDFESKFNVEINWDVFPSNMSTSKDSKTIQQNGSDPRLAFSSFIIKKGMRDVSLQMKIGFVSWVGVGIVEASKVEKKDFTWNFNGEFKDHQTHLWCVNGYIWTNSKKKLWQPGFSNGQLIDLKVCVKEQKLKMKSEKDNHWVVDLPITLPVCFCVNLGGSGDNVTIMPKK
jgi:hypothetical protein